MSDETRQTAAHYATVERCHIVACEWSDASSAQTNDSGLQIADRVSPGATIYIDGRFYRCADRVRLGGDGLDDIIILARIRVARPAAGSDELLLTSVAGLDAIEREGRAAIVAQGEPRPDALGIPSISPSPTDLRSDAGLVLA
jgi:hypothetical protein